MYSFIFGFQRFVWWPKCTPASSRSCIAIAKQPPSLTLTELEALARSRHAVLLAFLRPRVARQQPLGLERLAQLRVVFDQRARNPEPHRARLARHAAACHGREHVEFIGGFGQDERLLDLGAQ